MKVEVSLHATGLKNVAGPFGQIDPFAVVTQMTDDSPGVIGKTETLSNTQNPAWVKVFHVEYELGKPSTLIASVFHAAGAQSESIGSAVFEVGETLGSRGGMKAKRVGSGTLFCQVRKSEGRGLLRLSLDAKNLKNTEGLMRKPDPYYELSRCVNSAGGLTYDNVFRSRVVMDSLNPSWEGAVVSLATLCGGDLDALIQVAVYDHEPKGKHVLIGQLETSANGLASAVGDSMKLTYKGETTGQLEIKRAELTGLEETAVQERVAEGQEENETARGPPTFLDYISGGCQLNVVVAIDFTGSNGDPREPGTLHHVDPDSNNPYEKAITSIVGVLAKYDHDQRFPVLGFGAKYSGVVQHAFTIAAEARGVDGVLEAYHAVFKTGLIMSSPTVFTEVVEAAATRARSSLEQAQAKGLLAYTILLIVSDGGASDVRATADCLKNISDSPLSVVIVGVGEADFSAMQFLDDLPCDRDLAQFVEFNKHSSSSVDLSSATLHEIPGQLTGYFDSRGIAPGAPIVVEEEEIVVEAEEEEIDLTLDFGEEDIVVSGTGIKGRGAW